MVRILDFVILPLRNLAQWAFMAKEQGEHTRSRIALCTDSALGGASRRNDRTRQQT